MLSPSLSAQHCFGFFPFVSTAGFCWVLWSKFAWWKSYQVERNYFFEFWNVGDMEQRSFDILNVIVAVAGGNATKSYMCLISEWMWFRQVIERESSSQPVLYEQTYNIHTLIKTTKATQWNCRKNLITSLNRSFSWKLSSKLTAHQ